MKNFKCHQPVMLKALLIIFVYATTIFTYAQEKTYASSQNYQVSGVCAGCTINNAQNAVGNNESDYALIKMLAGIGGTLRQNLIFPEAIPQSGTKVVIGIGNSSDLSVNLLGGIYIESYLGNVGNDDSRLVDSTMLKLGQDKKRGTITFTPAKRYDRIQIRVTGVLGLDRQLMVYSIYHTPTTPTTCATPLFSPTLYYPFNWNTKDMISGMNLIPEVSDTELFQNEQVCGNALVNNSDSDYFLFKTTTPNNSMFKSSKTVSFWARSNDISSVINIDIPRLHITFLFDQIDARTYMNSFDYITAPVTFGQMDYYTIIFREFENEDKAYLTIYKNGDLLDGHLLSCTTEPGQGTCQNSYGIPINSNEIKVGLKNAQIDELIVYDKALSYDEIRELSCSYGKPQACIEESISAKNKREDPVKKVLTVSPNPTSGQIALDGNLSFEGSEISIRNTSGTEVYHSPFRSKTFELPTSLPGGVYMLTLQTKDKKIYTRKIILNR